MKKHQTLEYIETPRKTNSTVARIDTILEERMKEFLLSRRRFQWIKFGS